MLSIAAHIDPATIVAEIRMERQVHRGAFLLVEGSTDAKRITKFLSKEYCSIVNCFGKPNVIDALELMQDVGLEDCLGLVDSDFDRILGREIEKDGLVASAYHDFDIEHALTDVIDRYLAEVADERKLAAQGGPRPCVAGLLLAIRPLSLLRYVNEIRGLRYYLRDVNLASFFDGVTIDFDQMIASVSTGRFSSAECQQLLKGHIDQISSLDFDLLQLTNGHDFIEALGIALQDVIGSRKIPQTWRSEVELHLRFGLSREDFVTTRTYEKILAWQVSTGFTILRN